MENWKQFLSILFIGGIAVTLFVGLEANAQSISNRVDYAYEEGNMADLWVTTSSYDSADQANIDSITGGRSEGRIYYTASLEGVGSYAVISAAYPEISRPWEIVEKDGSFTDEDFFLYDSSLMVQSPARDLEIHVGDEVAVSIVSPLDEETKNAVREVLDPYVKDGMTNILAEDNIVLKATVNGAMNYPENVNKASYNRAAFLMSIKRFALSFLDTLNRTYDIPLLGYLEEYLRGYDGAFDEELLLSVLPDGTPLPYQYTVELPPGADLEKIKRDIGDYFASKDENDNLVLCADRDLMPFSSAMQMEVDNARNLTYVFPFVFFFVAVLVILTTTSQIIIKERTQIGAMRAIGVGKTAIYLHYMALVGVVVLLGTIIGEVLGPVIIPYIMNQKYAILFTLPAMDPFLFPIFAGILTAAVFLGVSCLVTFLAARKTVKLLPANSLRPEPPAIKGKGRESSLKPTTGKLSLRIALRNIRTNLVKSLMVIVGVAGCTALLVCGFGIEDTINHGIDTDLSTFYNSDLELTYSGFFTEEEIDRKLEGIDAIDFYLPLSISSASVGDAQGVKSDYRVVEIAPGENRFPFELEAGECAMSAKVARQLGAEVGDVLAFELSDRVEVTVSSIFPAFSANAIFLRADTPGVYPGTPSYSMTFVYLKTLESVESLKDYFLEDLSGVMGVMTHDERVTQISDIVGGVLIMTNAVKVFAVLLALVVLVNLALLNYRERTRDIATLKVLGFSRGEIAKSLLFETMVLTLGGVVAGMLLGWPFMYAVLVVNTVPLVEFLYFISPWTYVIGFALTFLVALLVNLYLSTLTKRVKMVESLKSVE